MQACRRVCATGLVDSSTSGSNLPSAVKVKMLDDCGSQDALAVAEVSDIITELGAQFVR